MQPKVALEQVWMTYHTLEGEVHAVKDLSFQVQEKEFVSIVGPSGCGKSTVLSLIAGLLPPSRGRVLINGEVVQGPSPRVGYMLQHDHLFEWRTILQNALLGLEVQQKKSASNVERVKSLLANVGLADFLHNYPAQLSGGMRQRAALVRTLALDPDVLLLDEPFSALDYQTRLCLEEELLQLLKKLGRTVILVTHDISEAVSMSDRVVVMTKRPGTVLAEHELSFRAGKGSPFEVREAPEFHTYFNTIWKELQDDDD